MKIWLRQNIFIRLGTLNFDPIFEGKLKNMKFSSAKSPSRPQITPVQDASAAKRTLLSRLLPLIIFLTILATIAAIIYYYNFMPRAIGRLQVSSVEMSSKRPAFVKSILVSVGDEVKKGQLLAELDTAELEARKDKALKALALAKESLESLKAELRLRQDELRLRVDDNLVFRVVDLESAKVMLNQDVARLESSKARLAGALIEQDRFQKLVSSSAAAQKQLDLQTAQTNALQKEVEWYEKAVVADTERGQSAEKRLAQYVEREGLINVPINEMLRPAIAEVAVAEAEVSVVAAQISDSMLVSPIDGMVSGISKRPGFAVDIAEPVMTLMSPSKRHVEAYVQEQWSRCAVKDGKVKLRSRADFFHILRGSMRETGNCVVTIPLDFLEPYETFKYKGLRFVVEMDKDWDGPTGSRFDILF